MPSPHIAAPVALAPRGRRTPTTRRARYAPPDEAAFATFLADRRLSPFDKLLLTILAGYCLAPGNAFAWPSSAELGQAAGVAEVKDGGKARVNRSLARLEGLGLLTRIAWHEIGDFMASVGGPRLGLADPRERAGNACRFLLLWWKVPGLAGDFAVALKTAPRGGARDILDGRRGGAVDSRGEAPASPGVEAPAPPLPIGSKLELLNGTKNVNVDAAPPGGGGETTSGIGHQAPPIVPPAAPTTPAADRERAAREIIRKCESRNWRISPDGSLDVPPTHRGLVAPPTDAHRAMLAEVWPEVRAIRFPGTGPGHVAAAGPAMAELIRRVASPCGPEAVEAAARRLAIDLDDESSLNYHRARMAEVRAGSLPVKAVLSALASSRGNGVADRRKVYTNSLESERERLRTRAG